MRSRASLVVQQVYRLFKVYSSLGQCHDSALYLFVLSYVSIRSMLPVVRRMPRSDSAVKQILLTMNEKESFIIEDLDDHHVVIKADEEWRVRRELETEVRFVTDGPPIVLLKLCNFYVQLEKNTYSLE